MKRTSRRAVSVCVLVGALFASSFAPAPAQASGTAQAWRLVEDLPVPGMLNSVTLVFDRASSQLLLIGGGTRGTSPATLMENWLWDGDHWSRLQSDTSPPAREWAQAAYDPATGQVVLFGGWDPNHSSLLGDTWIWDGSTWRQAHPATSPLPRYGASMFYDPATNTAVRAEEAAPGRRS